jgi:hypothetical protein
VNRRAVVPAVLAVALVTGSASGPATARDRGTWAAAWGASPVVGSPIPWSPACQAGTGLTDQTVRNVLFTSTGGSQTRIRLTNVTMVAGGQALSDPVDLAVAPLSKVLVSVHVPGPTGPVTNHPFTAQGNYIAAGDQTGADGTNWTDNPCWMLVDGVDVKADSRVVDAGLGGNRVLAPRDGEPYRGVPALARLHRDVFSQTGVRAVIVFEGIDDLGYDATAAQLIAAYQQIIALARQRGLRVYGATITPFKDSFIWTERRATEWRAVNHWIRTSHAFDGVFDVATATADPDRLNPAHDSGDHLHPNDAGCRAVADAVDLRKLLTNR